MNTNKKKLGTLNLQLAATDATYKVGKTYDKLNYSKCAVTKDGNKYKLTEKKSAKEETNYTGTKMTEQNSRYLIMKVKSDGKTVEAFPSDDWFTFKKDISYATIGLEEAEEKMKIIKGNALDIFLKNKSATVKKEKKTKEEREETGTGGATGGGGFSKRFVMEDDEDDRKYFNNKKEEEDHEDKDSVDLDLKEMPSDIEEGLKGKEGVKKPVNNFIPSGSEEESEDSFFSKKNDENSDLGEDDDDDISQIDNEYFLKQKRSPDHDLTERSGTKVQKTGLDESLRNLLSKNGRMTEGQIVKELNRLGFMDLARLSLLLIRMCNKFQEGKDVYYFNKPE
jgi:hypothetical protein